MKIKTLKNLLNLQEKGMAKLKPEIPRIAVGMSTCGLGNEAESIYREFKKELKKQNVEALLTETGCFGYCAAEPMVNIYVPGKPLAIMSKLSVKDVKEAVRNIKKGNSSNSKTICRIDSWNHHTASVEYGSGLNGVPLWNELPYYRGQKKDVLRNCGIINPNDIEEYIGVGGYRPLYDVLNRMSEDAALEEIKASGLRGRGGAGFPVWLKWSMLKQNKETPKYIICNADEGDPGAYMNRNELEGDPHMIIEGMIIAGYMTGARQGVIYCRAEYPIAVKRLSKAIQQCRKAGILGKSVMGTKFSFDIQIVEGAGAFVCGEETALISSIQGDPGWPMPRPPYPSEKGLYGKPTCINNVETFSNIPMIIARGGEDFSRTGTEKSTGTKVFSLVGKIKNTGLVELPLGTPLRKLVYDIGGGGENGKKIKAVQTGGPSGGCIPASHFDCSIDYEALAGLGAIMGSGGVVVMDEDNCMVDVAHYFTEFTTSESCGKCVPCREGINHTLHMLSRIKNGEGEISQMAELEKLSNVIRDSSLCGLGQTGPNPVVTTMKYFRDEYEQHIKENYCQGGVCENLFVSPCENSCPLHMNVPGYLQLCAEGRLEYAFDMIIRDNPLPSTLGRICHFHCRMQCRRDDIDAPVAQGEVHRYVADRINDEKKLDEMAERLKKDRKASTGKKIAVIGAGPAGLTAAFYLAMLGHKVSVYEEKSEAGGILRWGIPRYRLPKDILKREIDFIRTIGVDIKTGRKITPQEFKKIKDKNNAVIVSTGAYRSRDLKINGIKLKGVSSGTSFLEKAASDRNFKPGKKVVVIGGGNVAIDAARTAVRYGAEVTVVYRRGKEELPAIRQEIEDALEEKIKFRFWRNPDKFVGEKGKLKALRVSVTDPGEYDMSGRRRPVPTEKHETLKCDRAVISIGEDVDSAFLKDCGVSVSDKGCAAADPFTMEVSKGIYAAGDVVSGPSTAAEAMEQGKKAARRVDFELMKQDRFESIKAEIKYRMEVPEKPDKRPQSRAKSISLAKRKSSFDEVRTGFTAAQALTEAARCLRCDVKE